MRILAAGIYILFAILFVLFSGRAEGLASVRSLSILVALLAVIHACFELGLFILSVVKGRTRRKIRNQVIVLCATGSLMIALIIGGWIDHQKIEETQRRGDLIALVLEQYIAANGTCPSSLAALKPAEKLPIPALAGSVFRIWPDDTAPGRCDIMFDAPAFLVCSRRVPDNSTGWFCHD